MPFREPNPTQREELAREATRELIGDRFAYTMTVHTPLAKDNVEQALHDAVEKQSAGIGRQVAHALATLLRNIKQAAAQVSQNVKDIDAAFAGGVLLLGVVGGLRFGYFFVMRTQNAIPHLLNRIDQFLSVPAQPVPAVSAPPVPDHGGKAK